MYTGRQHALLMDGIDTIRRHQPGWHVDLRIVSAGYGLLEGERPIAPYNATFDAMPASEARAWGQTLGLPEATHGALVAPFDLGIVLLGAKYRDAAGLRSIPHPGGPLLIIGGKDLQRLRCADPERTHLVVHGSDDPARFGATLTALKGAIAKRILTKIAHQGEPALRRILQEPASQLTHYLWTH